MDLSLFDPAKCFLNFLPSIHPSINQSIHSSIYPSMHLCIYPSIQARGGQKENESVHRQARPPRSHHQTRVTPDLPWNRQVFSDQHLLGAQSNVPVMELPSSQSTAIHPIHPSLHQSICPSIYPFIYLSVCPSVCPSICKCIFRHPSICLSLFLSLSLSLSLFLSFHNLSIYLSTFQQLSWSATLWSFVLSADWFRHRLQCCKNVYLWENLRFLGSWSAEVTTWLLWYVTFIII